MSDFVEEKASNEKLGEYLKRVREFLWKNFLRRPVFRWNTCKKSKRVNGTSSRWKHMSEDT